MVPPDSVLERWREEGLTARQMSERVRVEYGREVSDSTIGVALHRAGLTERVRHWDTLPWPRIRAEHNQHYAAQMLRYLGRRRSGEVLPADKDARLESWLGRLRREDAVVVYVESSPDGFYYVRRVPGDRVDVPVRLRAVAS